MSVEPAAEQQRRLDPFILPSATAGRFLLLVLTAVTGASYLYAWLAGQLDTFSGAPQRCAHRAQALAAVTDWPALAGWFGDCLDAADLRQALAVAALLGGLVVVTVALYLAMPSWIARPLTPIDRALADPGTAPVAQAVLAALPRSSRRRRPIEVYTSSASTANGGRAFGRLGRYCIAVDLAEFRGAADRPERTAAHVTAIVRHELAHVRNGDIDLTYLAIASWLAASLLALIPLLLVAVRAPHLLPDFAWRVGVLLVLLWLARAAVLRTREFYADVRAAASPAYEAQLALVIDAQAASPAVGYSVWERLRWYLRRVNHPSKRARLDVLRGDTVRLFEPVPGVAFAAGALIGVGFSPTLHVLTLAWPDEANLRTWAVSLFYGLLGGSVLTGVVWRATARELACAGPAVRTGRSTLALVGGILSGQMITPELPVVNSWGQVLTNSPASAVLVAALLLMGCAVCLRWTVLCARNWLTATRTPQRAYRFGVPACAAGLGMLFAFWFQTVEATTTLPEPWLGVALRVGAMLVNPEASIPITVACLYPLLAWRTRRPLRYPLWRNGDPDRLPTPARPPLLATVLTGLAVLCVATLIEPLLYGRLRSAALAVQTVPYMADDPDPLRTIVPVAAVMFGPALLCTAMAAIGAGLWFGRRRRGQAVAMAGGVAVLCALLSLPLGLLHVGVAFGGWDGAWRMIEDWRTSLSIGVNPFGALHQVLLTTLLAAALPLAMLGAVVSRGASTGLQTKRRPPWTPGRTVLLAAPLLIAALVVGYGGMSTWTGLVTGLSPLRLPPDTIAVSTAAASRPGTITRAQACVAVVTAGRPKSVRTALSARPDYNRQIATGIAAAGSADDPVMLALGRSALVEMAHGDPIATHRRYIALTRYCGLVEP